MPVSDGERAAYFARRSFVPRRAVPPPAPVPPLVRFGRKWLWDLTVTVSLNDLAFVLEAEPAELEERLAVACAAIFRLPLEKITVELIDTNFAATDAHSEFERVTAVQLVLWSQYAAVSEKKMASWVPLLPPRTEPRPARNYLVTASKPAVLEARKWFRRNEREMLQVAQHEA
ncbi:hypothetical protein M885DRAFT_559232 [Pelagophyceae sp. CCMP2097]|nr:hypothetical protein M885DRAFT_559232 [Pelagophyceae sp. CCMP2097]|mmetsp:Transcript_17550/g.62397  ORF Transcript_17550/g.62397 Transcript_17550/m.62397 type:complete len:173 (-) Transcript_17550:286-804(-)